MMNELDVRKKMLEDLMAQMDERQLGRLKPQQPSAGMPPMVAPNEMAAGDADQVAGLGGGDDDELTKKLRQASMSR